MTVPAHIAAYLERQTGGGRPLVCSDRRGIEQVVVIPALGESTSLAATLASLSRNPRSELMRTLVLCVINNRESGIASPGDIRDNQETIGLLAILTGKGRPWLGSLPLLTGPWCALAREDRLRVAYIDASSAGREMPAKEGGVGAVRKIGMDAALGLFDYGTERTKLIISLDADTLVQENYLATIRSFFSHGGGAAVIDFRHQRPSVAVEHTAILCYETMLRYYVLGLGYAGSPYAFHTIGSTMALTADAYVAAGGMNRRDGGEDFYFLNKLAKYRPVGTIRGTTVFPSARCSHRVPFGTGRWMIRFLKENKDPFLFYDPRVFAVLKGWLAAVPERVDRKTSDLMSRAFRVDPRVHAFLQEAGFPEIWERIKRHCRREDQLRRQFHGWFDAFKTLKLIHFLTGHGLEKIDLFRGIEGLLSMMEKDKAGAWRQKGVRG